ncbi:putative F-box protein At5g62660 [Brachypodium distachyon]|uniref:putative F-box protein At5g62660 n=1 Tax=Brachypodium distachyon TaxID=15368 RepID=UPI00071D859C|nr:putative F-box protein At5g62660 [Brachypodium distachyon]|eukprot:XP_014754013.1 putative F-box protein At5g62660 [Brachypodium distachyon]
MEPESLAAADDMLPSLPLDVISEILSRTPVKSVCRFRCVSKAWHSLISNAAFLATHKEPPRLVLVNSVPANNGSAGPGRDLRLKDLDGNVIRVIKDAGAFLVMCSGSGTVDDGSICISLNKFDVNVVDLASGNVLATSAGLRTESVRDSAFSYGVGRAIPSGAYKLVCLARPHTCKVITLEADVGWRQKQLPAADPAQVSSSGSGYPQKLSVTVNGIMHFFYRFPSPQVDRDYILCFDLESEEWKESMQGLMLPAEGRPRGRGISMIRLNDKLCMVEWKERTSNPHTNIWLLADSVNSTWVKTYTIPMAPATGLAMPLRMMPDGGKLLVFFFPGPSSRTMAPTLQIYDPFTGSRTHLINFQDYHVGNGICGMDLKCVISSISSIAEPQEFNLSLLFK